MSKEYLRGQIVQREYFLRRANQVRTLMERFVRWLRSTTSLYTFYG